MPLLRHPVRRLSLLIACAMLLPGSTAMGAIQNEPLHFAVVAEAVPIPAPDPASVTPTFRAPLASYRLSSPFGPRRHPIRGRAHRHTGADMAAPRGTPVEAVAPGVVTAVRRLGTGYGQHVVVEHAAGYSSWYAHLHCIEDVLEVGTAVVAGQRLGAVGSSGSATGPHLHLEIRLDDVPQEPLVLIEGSLDAPAPESIIGIAPAWRANAAPP